jgi:hypothetical protein
VYKFYLLLWLKWGLRLTLESVAFAALFSFFITLFIYVKQGSVVVESDVVSALVDVFMFWFVLLWSVTLLLALFRGMKYIFNSCSDGYKLELFTCEEKKNREVIDVVGYGNLVKVWRKWFMLMIWLVAVEMIVALLFTTEWFSIVMLYGYILLAGFFSFIILSAKCKRVRIGKC